MADKLRTKALPAQQVSHVVERLREWAESHGMLAHGGQARLAEKLGVSAPHLSNVLKGKVGIGLPMLQSIAGLMGVSAGELLGEPPAPDVDVTLLNSPRELRAALASGRWHPWTVAAAVALAASHPEERRSAQGWERQLDMWEAAMRKRHPPDELRVAPSASRLKA